MFKSVVGTVTELVRGGDFLYNHHVLNPNPEIRIFVESGL